MRRTEMTTATGEQIVTTALAFLLLGLAIAAATFWDGDE
jgi:hypothetical protein